MAKRRRQLGEIKRSRRKVAKTYLRQDVDQTHLTQYARSVPTFTEIRRGYEGDFRAVVCINTYRPMHLNHPDPKRRKKAQERCGQGKGTTPTRALKKAFHALGSRLK